MKKRIIKNIIYGILAVGIAIWDLIIAEKGFPVLATSVTMSTLFGAIFAVINLIGLYMIGTVIVNIISIK